MQVLPTLVSKVMSTLSPGGAHPPTNRQIEELFGAHSPNLRISASVCSNSHRQHRTTVNAEQAYRLDVRRGGHVGRDVLRTCLGVPLQAAEDLVWCADEVKPVAGAL